MLGNNLHNANDGNREQQTPYPLESASEEQRNKYRHWIHLRDVAGHPGDDKDATEGGDPQRARVSQRVRHTLPRRSVEVWSKVLRLIE